MCLDIKKTLQKLLKLGNNKIETQGNRFPVSEYSQRMEWKDPPEKSA